MWGGVGQLSGPIGTATGVARGFVRPQNGEFGAYGRANVLDVARRIALNWATTCHLLSDLNSLLEFGFKEISLARHCGQLSSGPSGLDVALHLLLMLPLDAQFWVAAD